MSKPAFATQSVDPKSFVGRIIAGRFRLDRCIGSSGDTLVFRATQLALNRAVAVKLLLAPAEDAQQLGARLRREAKIVASLEHPNIATVYDQGVAEDGMPFIAMELLDGENLEEYLARQGRLSLVEAIELTVWIANALAAVHRAGFVHRDVKPANACLTVDANGNRTIKLIDFGTSRPVALDYQRDAFAKRTLAGMGGGTIIRTLPGIVFGTPWYMSPEQCRGAEVDARSDIYSLAALFYDLVTGRPPFDDDEPTRVMAQHLAVEPQPPSKVAPEAAIPDAVDAVVLRALSKEPLRRYANVETFAAALTRAQTQAVYSQVQAGIRSAKRPASEAPIQIPTEPTGRWMALVAVAILLCASGAWLWHRSGDGSTRRKPPAATPSEVASGVRVSESSRTAPAFEQAPVASSAASATRRQATRATTTQARPSARPGVPHRPSTNLLAHDPNYSLQELKVPERMTKDTNQ